MPYAWILALAMMQEPQPLTVLQQPGVINLTWSDEGELLCNLKQCTCEQIDRAASGTYTFWSGAYKGKCHTPKPEPIDVPAVERKRDDPAIGYGIDCASATGMCEAFYQAQRWYCTDPSRYLIGPNGNGEYICHRAQQ